MIDRQLIQITSPEQHASGFFLLVARLAEPGSLCSVENEQKTRLGEPGHREEPSTH